MFIPTSKTTAEDIIQADRERFFQVLRIAMAQCGPHPEEDDERAMRAWCRAVNRHFRKIAKRLN